MQVKDLQTPLANHFKLTPEYTIRGMGMCLETAFLGLYPTSLWPN